MKTIAFCLIATLTSTAGVASASSCQRTKTVGMAHVNQPGFAQKIRKLRAFCAHMESRHEEASIEWSQYDRAYECVVGDFCD